MLVVGLGPAGGAAAAAAAQAGLDVIAVERRHEIGVPVQCAEFIPMPLGRFARGEGVLQQRIAAMRTRLPSGAVRESDFSGLMIDRAAFDRSLAERARQAGARLLVDTALEALSADGRVRLRVGEAAREVSCKLVVAADGPLSKVAQCLALAPLKSVTTRQYTVPLLQRCEHTDIWLSAAYPGGYAWLFPKGPLANLGVGIDRRFGDDLKAPLDSLHRQLAEGGIVGSEIRYRTGGPIPVGGLRPRLVEGCVLFVGDAAGFTHPISGAGIAAAVISGEAAGEACAAFLAGRARALADYEEDMRDRFGGTIERGLRVREALERVWNTSAAGDDAIHRRGWIAFEEYYEYCEMDSVAKL